MAVVAGIVAALSIIIFIVVRRRRLAREQSDVEKLGLKMDVDGTRAVEMDQLAPVIDPTKTSAHMGGTPTPEFAEWVEEDEGEEEEEELPEGGGGMVELDDAHEDDVVLHEGQPGAHVKKRQASPSKRL